MRNLSVKTMSVLPRLSLTLWDQEGSSGVWDCCRCPGVNESEVSRGGSWKSWQAFDPDFLSRETLDLSHTNAGSAHLQTARLSHSEHCILTSRRYPWFIVSLSQEPPITDDVMDLSERTFLFHSELKKTKREKMRNYLKGFMLKVCLIPQRYILAIMGFLALANAYQLRVCLNITIGEMSSSNETKVEEKEPITPSGFFHWSESTQQLILGSFYWGYVASHLPGGWLADKFGGKYTLGLGILFTAVFTIVAPVAAKEGYEWLIASRVLAGLGEGTTFPGLNDLLARWVPAHERGFLGSFVFAGSQIGTIIGNMVSGALLIQFKGYWEYVFYLFGGLGVVWFAAWTFMCYGDPRSHPFITDKERDFLISTIGDVNKNKKPTPWRKMITSAPVLALISAQIGHDWGFYTMVTNLPKYMRDVLHFETDEVSTWTSVAFFVMWMCSLSTGWMADLMIKREWMTVTKVRKFFTTIAHIGPSVTLVAAAYLDHKGSVIALFVLTLMFMGTFYPGMKVNALDLSPEFAGPLMAVVNGIGGLTGIITPYLIGELAADNTPEQWQLVFWITFGVNIVTLVAFLVWGSGERQPWNDGDEEESKSESMRKSSDIEFTRL